MKWWNNKYIRDRPSIPAGHVAEPAEICTAQTDRCLCCATDTPSTAPPCNHWLWWCWCPHKMCCTAAEAGWQRPLLQTPGGRGRSQGAEQPCWPCYTRSDTVKCRKSVEKCVGHRRLWEHIKSSILNWSIDRDIWRLLLEKKDSQDSPVICIVLVISVNKLLRAQMQSPIQSHSSGVSRWNSVCVEWQVTASVTNESSVQLHLFSTLLWRANCSRLSAKLQPWGKSSKKKSSI